MLIRAKQHWLLLWNTAVFFALGTTMLALRRDSFLVPAYFLMSSFSAILWSSTYTTLSEGVLTKKLLFFNFRTFPVDEIASIAPHKKNGRRGYGLVINVFSKTGAKLTLQPNDPELFLRLLRSQAPQAQYLV
jgi:hypothetical protein